MGAGARGFGAVSGTVSAACAVFRGCWCGLRVRRGVGTSYVVLGDIGASCTVLGDVGIIDCCRGCWCCCGLVIGAVGLGNGGSGFVVPGGGDSLALGSRGGAVVLRDNVVGRMLRGEVGDVELGGDVEFRNNMELRSGGSMEQWGTNSGARSATCCATIAALWHQLCHGGGSKGSGLWTAFSEGTQHTL